MADSIRVAQPIRLQHLHENTSRILLMTDIFGHFRRRQAAKMAIFQLSEKNKSASGPLNCIFENNSL